MQNQLDPQEQPVAQPPQVETEAQQPLQLSQEVQQPQLPDDQSTKKPFPKPVIAIIVIILSSVLIIAILYFGRFFGPISYEDCAEIEGSEVVMIEPAYCITPEGKTFYKRGREIPDSTYNSNNTFNPAGPEITNPPN